MEPFRYNDLEALSTALPTDIESRKEFGDFGNVKELSPLAMWNGKLYCDFINNWGNSENCKKCNMRCKR